MILDNATTAMTGRQGHPGTGKTLSGSQGASVPLEELCRAIGADHVAVIDPLKVKALESEIRAAMDRPGVNVIIARRPCVLLERVAASSIVGVDAKKCKLCGLCLSTGCRALVKGEKAVYIDGSQCTVCGLCVELCPFGAAHVAQREVRNG